MAMTTKARFDPESDGADVGTATAFLLLPALLVMVAGLIFVSTGWVFRGNAGLFAGRQYSGAVTVDAKKHAGTAPENGLKVLLQPGEYTVRVKDGGYTPWAPEARPADGWFWVVQIDAGKQHFELGDTGGAPNAAAALNAHFDQTLTLKVDQATDTYFWITDPFPDDNEGSLSIQIEPVKQ